MSLQILSDLTLQVLKRDSDSDSDSIVQCATENTFQGNTSLRILSIFMILISSSFGTFFPLLASRFSFVRLPDFCWFFAKFFGSGVIIATGFMHLLQPASEALSNDCLGDSWTGYPWAFAICLISLFVLFFTEIIAHYFVAKATGAFGEEDIEMHTHSHFGNPSSQSHNHSSGSGTSGSTNTNNNTKHEHGHEHTHNTEAGDSSSNLSFSEDLERNLITKETERCTKIHNNNGTESTSTSTSEHAHPPNPTAIPSIPPIPQSSLIPGVNHFSHDDSHDSLSDTKAAKSSREKYLNQILSVFVLEFGVIFHSIFVGLSLAVAGEEFKTLFIVLIFHQMFEGLGLGTRIADTPWDSKNRHTPWFLALGFSISTPIAIAIGLGVRHSFVPGSRTALISNGMFDAISSGILIYTGIVELMAHEFLYSNQFKKKDGLGNMIAAYLLMCLGAALMALLAKWA
ncbi:hypothetical protein WICPIJ_007649 [Wickerhamomyces pijperi]|uniref:Zinc-regulated transporter 2 n=1 Tax=Wickerhamomyces pijperi TaxID=599730 RepID=A0A9P8TJW3_WICPI|nr:hypothetical protein WICPIJ_007649 [Wickerhamomyces pijperi]